MPKVAIVLATYNPKKEFFAQQIQSLKDQTFKDWICIVSDDQSNPEFLEIIKDTIKDDQRFIFTLNKNVTGSVFNFENGLKALPESADLIYFCDQDDVWEKDKLEKTLPFFEDAQVMMVHHDLSIIDFQGNLLADSCWEVEKRDVGAISVLNIVFRNSVTGCACGFRKLVLAKALPFPEQERPYFYHHDQWLALHALNIGKIVSFPEALVRYRQHGGNVVGAAIQSKKTFSQNLRSLANFERGFMNRQSLVADFLKRNPKPEIELELRKTYGSFSGLLADVFPRMTSSIVSAKVGIQLLIGYWLVKKERA